MPDREHPIRVLHLEDDPLDAELIRHKLAADGLACHVVLVEDRDRFEAALHERAFDIILCDYNLRSWDGLSALKLARKRQPDARVILVSGTIGEEEAVRSLHLGATDYLLKQRLDRLGPAVRRALDEAREHRKRVETEKALRDSEKQYRQVVENIHDALFRDDIDGKITFANDQFLALFGVEREHLPGLELEDYVAPEWREAVRDRHERRMRGEPVPAHFVYEGLRQDGRRLWLEETVVPLHDETGRLIGTQAADRDITERKKAEDALREANERLEERVRERTALLEASEARLRYLLSAGPAVIYSCRPGGDFGATWVSPNISAQLGYGPEDFLSDSGFWASRIHPDDAPRVFAELPKLFERDRHEHEYRFRRKDDEWRWMRSDLNLVRDATGAPREIVGAWLDITDRKRAEEEVAFQSELHRVAAEISTALLNVSAGELDDAVHGALQKLGELFRAERSYVFRFSSDFATLSNTHEWCAQGIEPQIDGLQDFPAETVPYAMGKFRRGLALHVPDVDALPPEAAAEQSEFRRQGIQSLICHPMTRGDALLGFFGFDYVTRKRPFTEGEIAFLRVVADALAGAVIRERDEAALREANARLEQRVAERTADLEAANQGLLRETAFSEALLDSLPGIFGLFDQTGRLLRWNRSFEIVSGYSADEIASMRALDFFSEEDRTSMGEKIADVFEAGAAEMEATMVAKDGKRIPFYFAGVRFAGDGVPCCIGTGIDVSLRKQLEEQLRQVQKMEAIGQLAGGVAHDFNNILSVITINGELALRQLGPEHPVRARVDEMMKAGERAAGLTRQLLAFSRRQVIQPRLLDLNDIVAGTHKMLGRLIGENIDLIVRPALDLGTVKADAGQIDQVILNLAVNARDAMPKGGRLTIETANADLDEEYAAAHLSVKPGRYVRLSVSDTGVGMDEATQQRIFEPFFTTKPVGQGTGLGLATVHGIVKQNGGDVRVYSEPGRGTTFKVYLPRVDEPGEAAPAEAAPAGVPRGHETILLVEDNEPLGEVIREALEGNGYTVLMASNGEEAAALAKEREEVIDLLLTDVVLPKLGGVELAKLLSISRPGIVVVYMSGYTDGVVSHHGVLAEGVTLLEKPFTGDKLARAVREALDLPRA